MARCASCGTTNPDGSLVCGSCGEALATVHPSYTGGQQAGVTSLTASTHDLIAGRYRLIEMLGKGGAGVVYRAFDMSLKEELALKLLQMGADENATEVERFKREIVTARKITHPNVIRIYDFGESGRDVFISMELLHGGTLTSRMRKGIPLAEGLRIALGVCDGLAAAHDLGIIHRDLKPDNILFDSSDRPKIVDFGLARLASASTRTVGFSGTPFYMSPEQANGEDMTPQSDIYSLGVVLFHLFAGRLPFEGETLARLVNQHCNEPAPPLRKIRADIPAPLERAILRALEKKPGNRPSGVRALANELRAVEAATGIAATPVSTASTSPATLHGASLPKKGGLGLMAGVAAALVLALGGAAGVWKSGILAPATPAPTPTRVAIATTAPPTATPTPTPPPAESPVVTVEPTVAPTKHAIVPTPKPPKDAYVKIEGNLWIEVSEGGKVLGKDSPVELHLAPGFHRLSFHHGDFLEHRDVELKAGQRVYFKVDTVAGTIAEGP